LVRVGKAKCSRVDAVLSLGIHSEIYVVTDGKVKQQKKREKQKAVIPWDQDLEKASKKLEVRR